MRLEVSKKRVVFISGLVLIAGLLYLILCYDFSVGRLGLPLELQHHIAIDRETIYKGQLSNMDIKGEVLRAQKENSYVSFNVPDSSNKTSNGQYLTVYVSRFNYPHKIVNNGYPGTMPFDAYGQKAYIYAKEQNGTYNGRDEHELVIRNGKNDTIILNSGKWQNIKIEFDNADTSLSIEKIILSNYPVVSSLGIPIFLLVFFFAAIVWYKIIFDKFLEKILKAPRILLIVIILTQLLSILYYTNLRKGFFGDEIGSILHGNNLIDQYNAGNIGGMTWAKSIKEEWLPSKYFFNVLSIQPKERFRYDIVYKVSQEDIAHPPFYHYQLHTVYSLFTDKFNKWIGIIPNLFWFIFTCLLLYAASKSILRNSLALLPVCLWGFSAGAISDAYLMRDYMSLTVFQTALLYAAYRFIDNKNVKIKDCVLFAAIVCFGLLSHYYFLIYLSLISLIIFCWFVYNKRYKDLRNIIIGMVAGIISFFSLWIVSISSIFGGRSGGALHELFNVSDISKRFVFFAIKCSRELFHGGGGGGYCLLLYPLPL
ncbi:MAG: glycosyltransferase family 39 protein [Elusimicrobiota bacterium]|jgi:hypothetical protein|nr:glycosyltransferase family 39 protein [Elusimicrobiota bacterium]